MFTENWPIGLHADAMGTHAQERRMPMAHPRAFFAIVVPQAPISVEIAVLTEVAKSPVQTNHLIFFVFSILKSSGLLEARRGVLRHIG